MTRFIFVGGLGVIIAIFGIFFFILAEIIPLFRGASVESIGDLPSGQRGSILIGVDEWAEYPFLLDEEGHLSFHDLHGSRDVRREDVPLPEKATITSVSYLQELQLLALGLSNGQYLTGKVLYKPVFAADGSRTIDVDLEWDPAEQLGPEGSELIGIDVFVSDQRKTVAAIADGESDGHLIVRSLVRKRNPFGVSSFKLDNEEDLTDQLEGYPVEVLVGANAESLVVRCEQGSVQYFRWTGSKWDLRQRFYPFGRNSDSIASMNFIKGEVSLAFSSLSGDQVVFSLYRFPDSGERLYGQTKTFEPFPGGADIFARSMRNKAFFIANSERISLRYSTTADIRWEKEVHYPLRHLVVNGKFDRILALDDNGDLHLYSLSDPHPEAGFRAFFARIWYEGQDSPQFIWQSSGGSSDDFEPKLSLIPLIVGSLKGTFYALLFALPIALLAAIYTSQFLSPELKRVIKPGIEIMASLPSVVLGFLAALWLAPLIEDRIPSVILICIGVPATAVLFGYLWNLLPIRFRILIPKGWEFIVFLPVMIIVCYLGWHLGPLFEQVAFRLQDPSTGQTVADFRLWWESFAGSQFQQRNSLVVGFMMGFAVIPIIYTIADDALSAVPKALTSASLALGASRWQTTARIVLPSAAAGIFSAFMIGLGRAVGETMIVVMATGNTPIMDMDIFSGMRTLSANIAVELPEAPQDGTLYRTLFLGAFVLFVLTFTVNTVAEVLRHRLRERYKVVG